MSRKTFLQVCFALVIAAAATSARAEFTSHDCVIAEIQLVVTSTAGPRVAVRCTAAAPGGISWFAYNMQANPDRAKMVLSLLSTAQAAGRNVAIAYESTDTSGNAWGCLVADCRSIMQVRTF
jgi:hypothetical protein